MTTRTRLSLILAAGTALLLGAAAAQPYFTKHRLDFHSVGLYSLGHCEYIVAARGVDGGTAILHHAACSNPAHIK